MTQGPGIVVPHDGTFMPEVFIQLPKVATQVSIRGLSWWNKFLIQNASSVKKNYQQ
jgi:hypothetical protein